MVDLVLPHAFSLNHMSLIELMGFWHGPKGVLGERGWEGRWMGVRWTTERSTAAFLCSKAMSGLSGFSLVLPDRTGGTSLYMYVSPTFMSLFDTLASFVKSWNCRSLLYPSLSCHMALWKGAHKGRRGKWKKRRERRNETTTRWNWFIFTIGGRGWKPLGI